MYQIGWTLPRWQTLVAAPLAARGTSTVAALAAFALFGAMYVIHTFAQVPQACLLHCPHCGAVCICCDFRCRRCSCSS